MAREITLVTPEHVELTFELAGIGSRFLAALLDSLIEAVVILGLLLLLALALGGLPQVGGLAPWVLAVIALLIFVVTGGYFLFFEATRNGQTPGKKLANVRVIRDTGHPLDFRAALLRNLLRLVDMLPGFYALGFLSVFFSPQYRRLGDYVAGTLVVRSQPGVAALAPPEARPPDPAGEDHTPEAGLPEAALPYLGAVTRDDYRAVRHFLERRAELDAGVADELARRLASPLAARLRLEADQVGDPAQFLERLARAWEKRIVR